MRSASRNISWYSDGKPVHSLGSPGNIPFTVPQMISSVLDYNYDPYSAAVLPRMNPMRDDFVNEIETRVPEGAARDPARIGGKCI
jgi:gamma-glutamyltranspeptidase / glutathione hydrolase